MFRIAADRLALIEGALEPAAIEARHIRLKAIVNRLEIFWVHVARS